MVDSFDARGFHMLEDFLVGEDVEALIASLDMSAQQNERRGGIRNLLENPRVHELANSTKVRVTVESVLGKEAHPVRGILFDKTEGANWKVPWHQDVTIAVKQKAEIQGYGPWSVKDGVLHVQPPSQILEQMVSLRFHLDDCPKENGALRVIAGSHKVGKLNERVVQKTAAQSEPVVCTMRRGGLLLMRPLLIHASSASSTPGHRRVIHLDYATVTLPGGMGWAHV